MSKKFEGNLGLGIEKSKEALTEGLSQVQEYVCKTRFQEGITINNEAEAIIDKDGKVLITLPADIGSENMKELVKLAEDWAEKVSRYEEKKYDGEPGSEYIFTGDGAKRVAEIIETVGVKVERRKS